MVGLQLWTVRQQMAVDTPSCLAQVAGAGYDTVELVGYGTSGFPGIRQDLRAAGLRALSQHVSYQRLAAETDAVIEENVALGCEYVVVQQGRHEDWTDADAVRAFAETCNGWGEAFRRAGLRLGHHGYHELDQEFAPWDGRTRWDLFAEATDPELVFLQLDTYWLRRSGHDPVTLLHRFAGRTPLIHMKDTASAPGGTATTGADDTTVGDGLMDVPAVLHAAAQAGTQAVIVEQEGDPANAIRDAATSRRNVTAILEAAA